MGETIVLPCGLIFTGNPIDGFSNNEIPFAWICLSDDRDQTWFAQCGRENNDVYGTRVECESWLSEQLLKRRAALTPPGHVVVGPDARERIARALCESSCEPGVTWEDFDDESIRSWLEQADAVLAALGVRG